jgi:predicted nucleic acid-binding protein
MSGVKFLLDTNILIGLLSHHAQTLSLLTDKKVTISQCAYSAITRMELLSYPKITESEQAAIMLLLNRMEYLPITAAIEEQAISYRRQKKGKLPDAIIAATALQHQLELLTLDANLVNKG